MRSAKWKENLSPNLIQKGNRVTSRHFLSTEWEEEEATFVTHTLLACLRALSVRLAGSQYESTRADSSHVLILTQLILLAVYLPRDQNRSEYESP